MNDDLIGKKLGQYEVLEEIGRGGMATVYRARQTSINRIVAIKVLPRTLLHDPGFFERFQREVDVIAHLEHPHILPIYDYGQDEGVPYIVMRYLAGGSMRDLIRRGVLPLEAIEKPLGQVAEALDHAHKQGIIHRDLKPGNIMLDENGNAYLTDFGIARVLGSDLTGSAIIGTPAYMSPEQANGLPLDARSDVYALGVVLFELITGREPYQAETPMALLLKHINEPMPAASLYRPGVPYTVETVIARATAKDPGDRYASAGELDRAYQAALEAPQTPKIALERRLPIDEGTPTSIGVPDSLPTPPAVKSSPRQAIAPQPPTSTEPPAPPSPPGSRPLLLLAGLGVLALFILAALVILPNLNVQPPAAPPDYAATFAAEARSTPTPFGGSVVIDSALYSLSMPAEWVPAGGFHDLNLTEARASHVWQADNLDAYVALILVDADVSSDASFDAAVEGYEQAHYQGRSDMRLIDTAPAPDGSIRKSYRLIRSDTPSFPPGQTDVFFMRRGSALVVMEMYSADSTGSTLVPTFQMILDSLRVKNT